MEVSVIKQLVDGYSADELALAEENLLEEKPLGIEVPGKDDGEKLTHIMAARWIQDDMKNNGNELRVSVRNFSQKVRKSID